LPCAVDRVREARERPYERRRLCEGL